MNIQFKILLIIILIINLSCFDQSDSKTKKEAITTHSELQKNKSKSDLKKVNQTTQSSAFSSIHKSQSKKWMRFTKGDYIKKIEIQDNYIWATTSTSLIRFNTQTEKITEYNNLNSPIPSNIISSLFIDKKGVKWLGTYNGLAKFDGNKWQIFNKDNSELKTNHIIGITGDSKGNIWIWTESGLVKYNGKSWFIYKNVGVTIKTTGLYKSPIYTDKKDNIWLGGFYNIVKFDGKDLTSYNYSNTNLRFSKINSIKEDFKGNIWFGTTGAGLIKYNNEKWERVDKTTHPTMKSQIIKSIDIDPSGNFWLGTYNGLAKFDGNKFKYVNARIGYALTVKIDKKGTKWIGTNEDYLIKYKNDKIKKFKTSISNIPSNDITSIQIGKDNSKWISTHYNGIAKILNNDIKVFNSSNSNLPSNTVYYLAIDDDNIKWIANFDKFASYNDKSFKIYSNKALYVLMCKKIEIQKKGAIWILNNENQLLKFDGKLVKNISSNAFSNSIKTFTIDNNDNIWVSLSNGSALYKLVKNEWVKYNNNNTEIPDNITIVSLVPDKNNNLWIGTSNKGLIKFDGKNKCKILNTENSDIPNNSPRHLALDKKGAIWFVSNSKLVKYDNDIWKVFKTEKTKLPQKIVSLKIDKSDILWIATSYGLYSFNEDGNE